MKTFLTGIPLGSIAPLALLVATASPAMAAGFITQTNIISDGVVSATTTDSTFLNPWGLSYAKGNAFWISLNHSGTSAVYGAGGVATMPPVTVPPPSGSHAVSKPTGQVFNSSAGFVVSENTVSNPASFIFATQDGTISGWNAAVDASNAILEIDNSGSSASYTGLAIYTDSTGTFLLAANIASGQIEVYDSTWTEVGTFRDTTLASTFVPYNVQAIGTKIYVAYTGSSGNALDRVEIDGTVKASVTKTSDLDAPWGLAIAPSGWGAFAGGLLVGNFGNGGIHVFNPHTLARMGTLKDKKGAAIVISGLWALAPGAGGGIGGGGSRQKIYFTAGPNHQADGIFGSLKFSGAPAASAPSSGGGGGGGY